MHCIEVHKMDIGEKSFFRDEDVCVRVAVVEMEAEAIPLFDSVATGWYWASDVLVLIGGRYKVDGVQRRCGYLA